MAFEKLRQLRKALRTPVYDDQAALESYKGDDDYKKHQMLLLEEQIGYSTASINNTYVKAQISAGLEVAVIALFVTVFWRAEGVVMPLLVAGVVLNAASIVLLRFVTSHRTYIWFEVVKDYGIRVGRHKTPLSDSLFLQKRNRANYNRWALLRNRRLAYAATWFLAVPGFVLGMMAVAPLGTAIGLAIALLLWRSLRWFVGSGDGQALTSPAASEP